MKKIIAVLSIALVSLAFVQCADNNDPFLITNTSVGLIHKDDRIKQVDSIMKNDSIVQLSSIENALGMQGEVEVYDKQGTKLMMISPLNESDPSSKITNIQIYDERYKTEKGLNVKSTFKDVKENYTIKNVQTTINAVVVFLEDSPLYLTIDKKQLSENLRYDPSLKIEASQIPETATFKYMMIGWDNEDEDTTATND